MWQWQTNVVTNAHNCYMFTDAIIIGMSKKNHLEANMDACEEGPLDERTLGIVHAGTHTHTHACTHTLTHTTGVVKAFDEAWKMDSVNCAKYFR